MSQESVHPPPIDSYIAMGTLPTRERYSPAFLNHQSGDLRDGHKLSQLLTVEPDLWDLTTSYQAHPGMPENVTLLRDAEWASGLTKAMIYPICTNSH